MLSALQKAHLHEVLSSARVANSAIPGVGPHLKRELIEFGISSALHVLQNNITVVPGFGSARAKAVVSWAKAVGLKAQPRMPQALSKSQVQAVRAKYEAQRVALSAELRRLEDQIKATESAVRAKSARLRQDCIDREAAPRQAAAARLRAITEQADKARHLIRRERDQLTATYRSELADLSAKTEPLRKQALGLQWEKARAFAPLKAYDALTFERYMRYVLLG